MKSCRLVVVYFSNFLEHIYTSKVCKVRHSYIYIYTALSIFISEIIFLSAKLAKPVCLTLLGGAYDITQLRFSVISGSFWEVFAFFHYWESCTV